MKEIGKQLQAKRRSLKLTYQDVAKMTKMSEDHLRAIEKGDFDYFKNDITYLRFYVRAYCKALDIPFEDIRDEYDRSMEEYTHTLSLKAIQDQEAIEENIHNRVESKNLEEIPELAKKDRNSIRYNVKQGGKFRKKGKFDISLLSLLAIVVVVIVALVFVLFSNTFLNNNNDTSKDAPKVNETAPTPEKEKEPETEKPKEKETTELTQTEISINQYDISGVKLNSDLKVEISFESRSWLRGTLNNTLLDLGTSTFEAGATATYEGKAEADNTFVFNFGAYRDTTIIKVNGQEIKINPALATSGGTPTITIRVIGE